ncbi:MAG: hypothetical protein L3J22_12075, partial [Xanthomonadales bacterium]|nr:hypothetical protein [Xanthomonadales bacterium]
IIDQTTMDAAKNFDCDRLEAMWAEGGVWRTGAGFDLAPPQGRLRGTSQLINVQEGTLYSFVATALTEFSDIPQHTGPESEVPNLSTPHDAGTASGNTQSFRCFKPVHEPAACIVDTWADPKNAVAAVLSSNELRGGYTINDEVGAKAELILTFPLEPFRTEGDGLPSASVMLDISGVTGPNTGPCAPVGSVSPCVGNYEQYTSESVSLVSFNDKSEDFGNLVISDILKDAHIAFFPEPGDPPLPVSSSVGVYFSVFSAASLTSNSGTRYAGVPVIGYILQKYTNGQLTNEQGEAIKANYGNAFELSQRGN